ncbi:MAG: hypothetical protein AMJ70_03600 [Dehalococcoidia bacterium SG8_51_3]|nr:MAG: hypothetical protein AMJ70_03600 [Dehalococcoidia bacterium SG8_51_3]
MICPVCNSAMIVIEYHNIEVDYCTDCNGVWFDSGELELMLKTYQMEGIELFLESIINSPDTPSDEKQRKCTICGRKMKKKAFGTQPKILIDVCGEGHGLWFDRGEIARLIKHLAAETKATKKSEDEAINFLKEIFKAP